MFLGLLSSPTCFASARRRWPIIERLGIELAEGAPLTVCDYDADEKGNPNWVVAEGVAHFDPERSAWQIAYAMDDVRWEPRDA